MITTQHYNTSSNTLSTVNTFTIIPLFSPINSINTYTTTLSFLPSTQHVIYYWKRIASGYGKTAASKLKFIVLLREPIARDYSSYQHGVREELYLGKTFDKIHTMLEVRTVDGLNAYGSQYVSQLGYMLATFRRDQVLVLSSTGDRHTLLIAITYPLNSYHLPSVNSYHIPSQ